MNNDLKNLYLDFPDLTQSTVALLFLFIDQILIYPTIFIQWLNLINKTFLGAS